MVVEGARSRAAQRYNALMGTYHPLGYQPLCGRQVRYLVRSSRYGEAAALSFSAAAWQLSARDCSDRLERYGAAPQPAVVVCNSRFLILPTVQVPHLASTVLALCTRQADAGLGATSYGVATAAAQTFVEAQRHSGASCRAANWQRVGSTRGRGRNDRKRAAARAPKDIYLLPSDLQGGLQRCVR